MGFWGLYSEEWCESFPLALQKRSIFGERENGKDCRRADFFGFSYENIFDEVVDARVPRPEQETERIPAHEHQDGKRDQRLEETSCPHHTLAQRIRCHFFDAAV